MFAKPHASIIEFYDRMLSVLAENGYTREPHQTPLEFAFAVNMPEAVKITEKYNRVRFGDQELSADDEDQRKEAADLIYHLLVLLEVRGVAFDDVLAELSKRTHVSGLAEKASRTREGAGGSAG